MKAAGISSEAVKKATGKDWKEWFAILDKAGAKKLDHRGIVEIVGTFGGGPWWQQMVTAAYEQERGLREKHQKGGGYAARGSRTVNVPLGKLYEAMEAPLKKEKGVEIRRATPGKSVRVKWKDGSRVSVNCYAKGAGKTQVTVQHEKLAGAKDVVRLKKYWGEALGELNL